MDTRSGRLYESEDAARSAGVPAEHLVGMEAHGDHLSPKNGPFKGRMYRRNHLGQLVRDRAAERLAKQGGR